jgi:hypothetical protein
MLVMHAVDEEVQLRAPSLLGLEVEDHAMDPVLRQRPHEIAAGNQADRREHGGAAEAENEQHGDRRHVDHDRDQVVHAGQAVQGSDGKQRRGGAKMLPPARRLAHGLQLLISAASQTVQPRP